MERLSTLKFPQKNIKIQVFEGPSNAGLLFNRAGVPAGSRDPMWLRGSYSADNKKGTLAHELGHRMNLNLRTRPQDLDEHRLLFLYLYDLYVDLYGKEFADGQVAFGRTLKVCTTTTPRGPCTRHVPRSARVSICRGAEGQREVAMAGCCARAMSPPVSSSDDRWVVKWHGAEHHNPLVERPNAGPIIVESGPRA